MNELKLKIQKDLQMNKRILEDDLPYCIRRLIELWEKYDKELLKMVGDNNE